MNDIKQGSPFSLKEGNEIIKGHIYIEGRTLWLCHNSKSKDGSPSPNKLGYKYSWLVAVNYSNIAYKIIKGIPKNPDDYFSMLAGYNAKMTPISVIFGCGEVKLKKEEIKIWNKIRNIIRERGITLTEKDHKVLNKFFI